MMVVPLGIQLFQEAPHRTAQLDIHPGGRLIEDQQLRLMHQRASDHQAALHAAGQHAGALVALAPQIQLIEVFFGARHRFTPRDAVVTRLVHHDLQHGLERVEVELLRHQAELALGVDDVFIDVVTEHPHAAGGFVHQRADDADGGGFTGTVWPQKGIKSPASTLRSMPRSALTPPA